MGVDYSHLIKITGSPEPLQLIRGIKKNNSTPFFVKPNTKRVYSSCLGAKKVTVKNKRFFYMKQKLSLFTILLMALAIPQNVKAYDFSAVAPSGQTLYYNIIDWNAQATSPYYRSYNGYTKPTGSLTIPSSVSYGGHTYSINSIGESAFYSCTGLTSITIPNSVSSIGEIAFYDCTGLTSITIPNSVTSIGESAFGNCTGLASIIVSSGNTTFDSRNDCNAIIETASNTLILGCQNTIIPNSVTSIGSGAFSFCTGLTSITIPNSVTSIGGDAFFGCYDLQSINSKSCTAPLLGTNAFNGVSRIIPITIPCGSQASYNSRWGYFSNFNETVLYTVSATSADSAMGSVSILSTASCTDSTVVLSATANSGYQFNHWSSGSIRHIS